MARGPPASPALPQCVWKLQGPSPHSFSAVTLAPGVRESQHLTEWRRLWNWSSGSQAALPKWAVGPTSSWRFYRVAGMLQAAFGRVPCTLNFLGGHCFPKFSFIQLQCKTVRKKTVCQWWIWRTKLSFENVKCRFCKKQNLAYEVPCFYDHKALDEMQLHFKNFCCLHCHSCNGQQLNYMLNSIASKGNSFLIIEAIFWWYWKLNLFNFL